MPVFKYKQTLLALLEPTDVPQQGAPHVILEGNHGESELSFKVWFDLTQTDGASSPTTTAVLQTSHDGRMWMDVVSSTTLSADGSLSEWQDAKDLGPYVRVVTVLGGATQPNHTLHAHLMSHNPFNTRLVR